MRSQLGEVKKKRRARQFRFLKKNSVKKSLNHKRGGGG